MAVDALSVNNKDPRDLQSAFGTFLERLKVPDPGQLILVQPQMVPEDLFDVETARKGGYYAYPPVGLLYLASVAKEAKPQTEVQVLDLNYELLRHSQSDPFRYQVWQDRLSDAIKACDAPHVGVTYMFGTTKQCFVEVCRFIRDNFPGVPIMGGGVQATYDYKELLESDLCDIVFRNEGEVQFKAYLERCGDRTSEVFPVGSAIQIDGAAYELGDPQKDVPIDWDIRDSYSQLDIENYNKYGSIGAFSRMVGGEKPFATVLGNRGCRARCTFCSVRDFNGFGVRQRPVESVVDEIKFLVREKGVQQIDWLDDDPLWNPKRAVELFKRMSEEVPDLKWSSSNGLIAAAITEEIMYWMAKSGLQAFKIGIESGNDAILHKIKKPTTKPKLREKRELFKKYPDIFGGANFIIGFPEETFGEMMDSYNFADELRWDWCTFNICQPLKGTDMFSSFQELGDDRCDEETYDKNFMPGRGALRGEVDVNPVENGAPILTGREVFNIPYDVIPGPLQLREIWFTFNLVCNFLNNLNYEAGGNLQKITNWFEAIYDGYPYDASMCAALVKGHKLLGNTDKSAFYQDKFESILARSAYWRRRIREFPELLEFAEVSLPNDWVENSSVGRERNWSGGAI